MYVRASLTGHLLFTNGVLTDILKHGLASTRRAGNARNRPDCHWHCDLAPPAFAVGEEITDVRVLDNQRTEESTVRSVAGLSIGDTLEADTLDMVRERLNTTGLFADVNVWWEPHGSGVRVNISVKDKFPWAPVPTASWSSNNKSIGLLFVHGNLFGRGKQLLLGARLAQIDSGAVLAYRDPSLFGTWMYWQLQGVVQRQVIPEYQNSGMTPTGVATLANPFEFRETRLFSYGFEPAFGVAWMRRVRTQVAWHLEQFSYFGAGIDPADPTLTTGSDLPSNTSVPLVPATKGGHLGLRPRQPELRLSRARVRGDDRRRRSAATSTTAAPRSAATSPSSAAASAGSRGSSSSSRTTSSTRRTPRPVTTCRSGTRTPPAGTTCAATSASSSAATRSSAARSSTTSRSSRSARSTFARSGSTTSRPSGSATRRTARP